MRGESGVVTNASITIEVDTFFRREDDDFRDECFLAVMGGLSPTIAPIQLRTFSESNRPLAV